MDVSMILSTLAAAKTLAAAMVEERDRQKVASIQIDLTEKLLSAQAQLAEVFAEMLKKDEAIRALTNRTAELELAQRERDRYELAQVGTVGRFFAYRLRPAAELPDRQAEPEHYVCQPCLDAGKKAVLTLGPVEAVCPLCTTRTQITPRPGARVISQGFNFSA